MNSVFPPDHRSPDTQHTYILLPAKPLGLEKLCSRSLGWQRSVGTLLCQGEHHPEPCSGCGAQGWAQRWPASGTCWQPSPPKHNPSLLQGIHSWTIPGPPMEGSWGLTPVTVYVRFKLTTSFQAFTTSPIWISTVHWHKGYQREEHWMSPSPFTLHLTRYRGGSCINGFFVWGSLTEQSLTFPLWVNSRLQSNLAEGWGYSPFLRLRVMLELSLPRLPHPPHQSPLCPVGHLGPLWFTTASPRLHLDGDFPWHCECLCSLECLAVTSPEHQNPHPLRRKKSLARLTFSTLNSTWLTLRKALGWKWLSCIVPKCCCVHGIYRLKNVLILTNDNVNRTPDGG